MERNIEDRVCREERRNGEDANVQPVELIKYVSPLERWQSLLVFQRPRYVVVGDVDIDRDGRVPALGGHLLRRDRGYAGRGDPCIAVLF